MTEVDRPRVDGHALKQLPDSDVEADSTGEADPGPSCRRVPSEVVGGSTGDADVAQLTPPLAQIGADHQGQNCEC